MKYTFRWIVSHNTLFLNISSADIEGGMEGGVVMVSGASDMVEVVVGDWVRVPGTRDVVVGEGELGKEGLWGTGRMERTTERILRYYGRGCEEL